MTGYASHAKIIIMIPSLNKQAGQIIHLVESRLIEAGHRVTAPRRAVLVHIATQGNTFTAADLIEAFKSTPSVGRATIFRTLDLLVEMDLLERVHLEASGASSSAYVLCGLADTHHHHTVCTRCGEVSNLEGCFLDARRLRGLSAQGSFRVDDHHLELYGVCAKCQKIE